ncbi:lipopolysaccharide biosynthesis protein [Sunxiuqinia rutila]|uniref:lipopolysaccharide biosynthesis protein n=1 Tax=Sunxiuqinia rutila TaxID=1397841 RepID=UPI003D369CCC
MIFSRKYITTISSLQFIQMLRFAVLLLIGVVLVRFYPRQEIGQYESFLFIAGALSFFWLRGVLQAFLALDDQEQETGAKESGAVLYFNSFLLLLGFSALAVLFLLIFKQQFQVVLNGNAEIPFFNWLLVYLFLASPSNFIEYLFLKKNKPHAIIAYGLVSYGVQFVLVILPPLAGWPILYAIQALVLVSGLRFVFLLGVLKRYADFSLSWPFLKRHFKLAYPLIGSSLLSGSGQYIDGAIVSHFYNPEMFAVFRYGARDFPLVIIMANALSHGMIPHFGRLSLAEALAKLKASSARLMHFLFPLTLVVLVCSNLLFPVVFTPQYALSAKIFNIYLLLITLRLIFPQTILIGRQITGVFLLVSLGEIVVNVGLSVILVQHVGVIGVAYATLFANLFERIVLVYLVRKKLHVGMSQYVPVRLYLGYSFVFVVSYFVIDFLVFPFPL